MRFELDQQQRSIADMADVIFHDHMTAERVADIEASGEWFDAMAWKRLARAGLIGTGCGVDVGGNGFGMLELATLAEVTGFHVAPLPVLATTLAAHAIDTLGTADQRLGLLPPVMLGDSVLGVAVDEPLGDPLQPRLAAQRLDRGWSLTGMKRSVAFWDQADIVVVTASTDGGAAVFLVDPRAAGIQARPSRAVHRQPVHDIELVHASAELLGPIGETDPARWLVERTMALWAVTQAGVVDAAIDLAASHTAGRRRFGRPIGGLQAVGHELADQYIKARAIRLTAYQAVWALAKAREAGWAVRRAQWCAAELGHGIADATQQVHGQVGVRLDQPLHRYTLWNRHIETTLGPAQRHLDAMGSEMVAG